MSHDSMQTARLEREKQETFAARREIAKLGTVNSHLRDCEHCRRIEIDRLSVAEAFQAVLNCDAERREHISHRAAAIMSERGERENTAPALRAELAAWAVDGPAHIEASRSARDEFRGVVSSFRDDTAAGLAEMDQCVARAEAVIADLRRDDDRLAGIENRPGVRGAIRAKASDARRRIAASIATIEADVRQFRRERDALAAAVHSRLGVLAVRSQSHNSLVATQERHYAECRALGVA